MTRCHEKMTSSFLSEAMGCRQTPRPERFTCPVVANRYRFRRLPPYDINPENELSSFILGHPLIAKYMYYKLNYHLRPSYAISFITTQLFQMHKQKLIVKQRETSKITLIASLRRTGTVAIMACAKRFYTAAALPLSCSAWRRDGRQHCVSTHKMQELKR